MLENITICQESVLRQLIAGAKVKDYLRLNDYIKDFDSYLAKKRIVCTFLEGRNFELEKSTIKEGGKIEVIKRAYKLPPYCFEETNIAIKLALIETYIIKRVNGCKCFK